MAGPYDIAGNFQPLSPNFAKFQVLSAAPQAVSEGRSYYDLTQGIGVYANGQWNYASGGGGGAVSSVFTRTGDVVAQSGDYTFAQIGSTPTTLSGYGITDPVALTSGSYSNPTWITGLAWSKITGTPTTISGYGITDGVTASSVTTFTNKTFNTAGVGNSFSINGTAITAVTGTGSVVLATSPTLVTPTLGVATATSVNKVTITAPTTSATLTLVTGSSLITAGAFAITLTSTATTNVTLPTSGTLYGTASASITSAQLLASMSDETGTGSLVFATSPTLVSPKLKTSVVSGTTQTLDATATTWVFTGAVATTWTLPAVTGNTDTTYFIKNRGSATITLTRAGSDNIYTTTTVTTLTINPGEGYTVINDGTYWIIL